LANGIVVAYSYDAASQLTGITYQSGSSVVGNLAYAYDLSGRRVGVTGSLAHTLLPAAVSTAAYNANNQLTNWNGTAPSYDGNGNMTNNGGSSFVWNARNQLVSFNGSSFQYDAFGRRTMNAAGTGFLYDGVNSVQELSGSNVTANILSGGVDENFLRSDTGGSWNFLSDALGSTVALTDGTGTVQTQYTYEPFGNTTSSGLSDSNPAQYTGRENEGNGLYYYRARYYSPQMGRFISEDPIGFAGGDASLYVYTHNQPTLLTDPTGNIAGVDDAAEAIAACLAYPPCAAALTATAAYTAYEANLLWEKRPNWPSNSPWNPSNRARCSRVNNPKPPKPDPDPIPGPPTNPYQGPGARDPITDPPQPAPQTPLWKALLNAALQAIGNMTGK
jgi:RHS repeat-associated protein